MLFNYSRIPATIWPQQWIKTWANICWWQMKAWRWSLYIGRNLQEYRIAFLSLTNRSDKSLKNIIHGNFSFLLTFIHDKIHFEITAFQLQIVSATCWILLWNGRIPVWKEFMVPVIKISIIKFWISIPGIIKYLDRMFSVFLQKKTILNITQVKRILHKLSNSGKVITFEKKNTQTSGWSGVTEVAISPSESTAETAPGATTVLFFFILGNRNFGFRAVWNLWIFSWIKITIVTKVNSTTQKMVTQALLMSATYNN